MKHAQWIFKDNPKKDTYVDFDLSFETASKERMTLLISADTDFSLSLNGRNLFFGQSPCYPEHPILEEKTFTPRIGKNRLIATVYYCGDSSFSTYCLGKAGLYFELYQGKKRILYSSKKIRCTLNPHYYQGEERKITLQLGYGFHYSVKPLFKGDWEESEEVDRSFDLDKRINAKPKLTGKLENKMIFQRGNTCILDFYKEVVGYPYLSFTSSCDQSVLFTYAEHYETGKDLLSSIGERDFSFKIEAKKGKNEVFIPLRRIALRYLEIQSPSPISIDYCGIKGYEYPFKEKPFSLKDSLDQKIYDTCIYTLKCCYHDHFEDCPWREQCLYALDSYLQMLSGYDAFLNREYMKSSLILFSEDLREDGLLSMTSPSRGWLAIPSFSIFYVLAVEEYVEQTQDKETVKRVMPRVKEIYVSFLRQKREDSLIHNYQGEMYWNFYEWRSKEDGTSEESRQGKADLLLNELFLLLSQAMVKLDPRNKKNYEKEEKEVKEGILKTFLSQEGKDFYLSQDIKETSQLGDALAILAGLAEKKQEAYLAKKLREGTGIQATLPMLYFVYQALLKQDKENLDFILADIRKKYGKMLKENATTFFEDEEGYHAFNNAGSLCHGWSSIPIVFYHLKEKL